MLNYSYLLTNTGNVILTAPFTVNDDKTSVTCLATPAALQPGETITCTASYTITQPDLDAGFVTNPPTGHGFFGQTVVDFNEDKRHHDRSYDRASPVDCQERDGNPVQPCG